MKLTCEYEDIRLAEGDMHLRQVLFAGSNLLATQSVYNAGIDSGRIYFAGQWRDLPEGEWFLDAGHDDAVVIRNRTREVRVIGPEGTRREFSLPNAGFPVALLERGLLMSIDQDDGAEDNSDDDLVSEGVYAVDFDGSVTWGLASDHDEEFREDVFSCGASSVTRNGTVLLHLYGGFAPNDEAWALLEYGPTEPSLTRLPLPKSVYGSNAITDLGGGWLCALGSYEDTEPSHTLRAWRRDGSGDLVTLTPPSLDGWISWRVAAGHGEFVAWHKGVVRRFWPSLA